MICMSFRSKNVYNENLFFTMHIIMLYSDNYNSDYLNDMLYKHICKWCSYRKKY